MEIKGNRFALTPSEAIWIAKHTAQTLPDLAKRTVQARRQAAMPFLAPGIFDGVPELVNDVPGDFSPESTACLLRHVQAERELTEAETKYAHNDDGTEKHSVSVSMSQQELMYVHRHALKAFMVSRHKALNFEQENAQIHETANELARNAAMEPERLSESDQAACDEVFFDDARTTMQVTAGILAVTAVIQRSN